MKIGIIGAGNIGTALAVDLSRKNEVRIYTSRPNEFSESLVYEDSETGTKTISKIEIATSNYERVVSDAELVFIALPTFMIKDTVEKIIPYLKKDAIVGCVPGAGGIDFLCTEIVKNGNVLFGFERVPYVARLIEYGKIVSASKKDKYRIATIPKIKSRFVADIIEELFQRPCGVIDEFLAMALVPTLHTSRIYDLYKDYKEGDRVDSNLYFYGDWRDSASELCFNLDAELHLVCDELTKYGFIMKDVIPYTEHYESETPELLTKKIRSISSLSKIRCPIKWDGEKYILDLNSRYFTESFPYRLAIVKGIADIVDVKVPLTDTVLQWYSSMTKKEYFVEGKFIGKDIVECGIPQNSGIDNINKLLAMYEKDFVLDSRK